MECDNQKPKMKGIEMSKMIIEEPKCASRLVLGHFSDNTIRDE